MSEIKFREINSIKDYIKGLLENGSITAQKYQKFAEITARSGIIGEEIVTVLANGLTETRNIVSADEAGNPDWVVTNPDGEKYIVKDSVFRKKYEKIEDSADKFKPIWNPITAAKINESISFIAPWGEAMNLVSGGYVVFDKEFKDIYAIAEKEFNATYKKIE